MDKSIRAFLLICLFLLSQEPQLPLIQARFPQLPLKSWPNTFPLPGEPINWPGLKIFLSEPGL